MFYDIKFPEHISNKFSTEINFNTDIISNKNGREQRVLNRKTSRNTYILDSNMLSNEDIEQIVKIFRIVSGRFGSFRFKDWTDCKTINQDIDITDGEKSEFQLIKTYCIPENIDLKYIRKITKPIPNSVSIKIDNQKTEDFTVDYNTGIINFKNTPDSGKTISSSFEFDIPVRFDTDTLKIKQSNTKNGEIDTIKLIEIL